MNMADASGVLTEQKQLLVVYTAAARALDDICKKLMPDQYAPKVKNLHWRAYIHLGPDPMCIPDGVAIHFDRELTQAEVNKLPKTMALFGDDGSVLGQAPVFIGQFDAQAETLRESGVVKPTMVCH